MDQVIHGVNKLDKFFLLSNYSLTSQVIIINFLTVFFALIFIVFFNFFLLTNNKFLTNHSNIINSKLNDITGYLSNNAIKRILTFDDNCVRIVREENNNCDQNKFINKNYEDKPPQLDPTYVQQYIYSTISNTDLNVKVFGDNWIKLADTEDFYSAEEDVIILDIDSEEEDKLEKNLSFYKKYENLYFLFYNLIKKYLDEQKLKKLGNENLMIMETIKTKKSISYIYKNQEQQFMSRSTSPVLKNGIVYGVVLIIAPLSTDDYEGASQSIILTNFFLFIIPIMFFLSMLFSKSIVTPIKILSKNAQLERDKFSKNIKLIKYPNRNDEIGMLSEDIKNMSEDLKKRVKQIEDFAADVSHELKNPLAGLKSSSDLLKINKLDEENKKILIQNMGLDIDRMNILISDISHYTLTQVEISNEVFQNIKLFNFLDNLKNSLSYKKYEIEIKSIEKEIILKVNVNKFLQVFHNLINNSETFIKEKSTILINVKIQNNKCNIQFVDQGPGIPLNYKEKVFERFYTDRDPNMRSHSGLGLSISKSIIESFEGSINLIKSRHKGFDGACFEIILPLKDL